MTRGHTGAGGDAATPECSVHMMGQDAESGAVRSPHTASSFVPDQELFRGVTPAAASQPDCATLSFSEASVSKMPSRSDSGMAGRVLSLLNMLWGKKKKGPAAASAQQPQEPEQLQLLQDGEWQSWAADDDKVERETEIERKRNRGNRYQQMGCPRIIWRCPPTVGRKKSQSLCEE